MTMTAPRPTTAPHGIAANADDLRDLSPMGYFVASDAGGHFEVLSFATSAGVTTGYALSRHGALVRFVQTGYYPRSNMVRCAITAAMDLGGPDATVIFVGESFGGSMPTGIAA